MAKAKINKIVCAGYEFSPDEVQKILKANVLEDEVTLSEYMARQEIINVELGLDAASRLLKKLRAAYDAASEKKGFMVKIGNKFVRASEVYLCWDDVPDADQVILKATVEGIVVEVFVEGDFRQRTSYMDVSDLMENCH
jgi:hypothetical protein